MPTCTDTIIDEPKEIFTCNFPDCTVSFVRKDLYDRHIGRHGGATPQDGTSPANASQRSYNKSGMTARRDPEANNWLGVQGRSLNRSKSSPDEREGPQSSRGRPRSGDAVAEATDTLHGATDGRLPVLGSLGETNPGTRNSGQTVSVTSNAQELGSSNMVEFRSSTVAEYSRTHLEHATPRRDNDFSTDKGHIQPLPLADPPVAAQGTSSDHISEPLATNVNRPDFNASNIYQVVNHPKSYTFPVLSAGGDATNGKSIQPNGSGAMLEDHLFHVSPSSTDDLAALLFQENYNTADGAALFDASYGGFGFFNNFGQLYSTPMQHQIALDTQRDDRDSSHLAGSDQGSGAVNKAPNTLLSPQKRDALVDIILHQFSESGYKERPTKNSLHADDSVISLPCMRAYIDSYWTNFHNQLPILHKPTFVPDTSHNYLLLAIVVMGAGMLNRNPEQLVSAPEASRFANFVSRNLRWQVFMDAESHPPSKLWVIQTLIILEAHEKLNADRESHERAHVYFPTTLTLMRRGTSLMGKWSFLPRDPSRTNSPRRHLAKVGEEDSGNDPASQLSTTWWEQWIAQEAAHRAAFAAFFLDATHATMFGHSATLAIHEIQLPLPCDDALWSASSASEVICAEASLLANGLKPLGFLEGLKRTLRGEHVHTNSLGRIILLAGLMSISWQMRQRELYGATLGRDVLLGASERWRSKVLNAFDCWKVDYDDSMDRIREASVQWQTTRSRTIDIDIGSGAFSQLGTVLYHHAHLAAHLNVPEVCVFAGAPKMLGRVISLDDYQKVHDRIARWATSANAADAVYHALRLCEFVMCPQSGSNTLDPLGARRTQNDRLSQGLDSARNNGNASGDRSSLRLNTRYDRVLYTPWTVYFAALILWAYGFVLDGPLRPFPSDLKFPPEPGIPTTNVASDLGVFPSSSREIPRDGLLQARYDDLRSYLSAMLPTGSSKCSLKDFKHHLRQDSLIGKRNRLVGLLSVLDENFSSSEWELIKEGRERLRDAGRTLKTGILPNKSRV